VNWLDKIFPPRKTDVLTPQELYTMTTPKRTTRLIGIGGRLRSGKDTVADYLVERQEFTKEWMSRPLDDAMKILDPLIQMPGQEGATFQRYTWLRGHSDYTEAKKNPEVRRFLQVLGTDFGRKMIHEDVWVNIAAKSIQELLDRGEHVVLTGVRFPNELEMIKRLGGDTWWIERPGVDTSSEHESEQALKWSDFDLPMINNSTLTDLYNLVTHALRAGEAEFAFAHREFGQYSFEQATKALTAKIIQRVKDNEHDELRSITTGRTQADIDAETAAQWDRIRAAAPKDPTPRIPSAHGAGVLTPAVPDKILPTITDEEWEQHEDREQARLNLEEMARVNADRVKGIEYIANDEGRTVRMDKMHKVAAVQPLIVERHNSDAALKRRAFLDNTQQAAERVVAEIRAGATNDQAMKRYTQYQANTKFTEQVQLNVDAILAGEAVTTPLAPRTRNRLDKIALTLANTSEEQYQKTWLALTRHMNKAERAHVKSSLARYKQARIIAESGSYIQHYTPERFKVNNPKPTDWATSMGEAEERRGMEAAARTQSKPPVSTQDERLTIAKPKTWDDLMADLKGTR
jgi:hypothetical protein